MVTCYAALAWVKLIPVWLLVLVVIRDLVIIAGAVIYNFRIERLEADPTLISKLNTVLQILLVLVVITQQLNDWFSPVLTQLLIYAVTLSVVWSGLDYVITGSRRARHSS